jgi:hypothetical protein
MSRPYILAETNWKAVKDTHYDVAVLPWGATEAHNYHLPYATDNYEADALASRSGAFGMGGRPKSADFANDSFWGQYRPNRY